MAWQPQEEPLRQLAQYLKDSLSGHDVTAQRNAELMLKQAKSSPDINNYLAYLFSTNQEPASINLGPENYHAARSAAAIMLKNDIKTSYKSIPDSSKSYIRSIILLGLQDPHAQIRNYAGNVITEVVRQGGIMGWPQILSELIAMVSNETGTVSPPAQEGAMGALLKICEDNRKALDKEYQGQRPLDFMFPKLLQFTTSPIPKVRASALAAINVFVPDKPQAILMNLDSLLQHLFQLAGDTADDVRKHVCRCFIHIAEINPDKIVPHMSGLVDYMIAQQKNDSDPELALDAAEFWLCVGEDENLQMTLGPYLPKIVPVLLESMVYCEDDILKLEGDEEDAEEEDRVEDIRPAFATAKGARMASGTNGEVSGVDSNGNAKSTSDYDDGELSGGELEDFDEEDGDGDPEEQWNLRKCSAAALDVLASVFRDPVFEVTLPYLKENLNHPEWPNREAAVLALGAIADGCMDAVQPHLPDLTQYLISLLQDKEPVVRQITCWSLGRYSSWAAHLQEQERPRYFEPMMDGILKRMLDNNKRVQEAAASAFANLEEKANKELKPYCAVIVRQFVQCFAKYKDRNMFILYDCVQTLAEHVGPSLAEPELVQILMPALIQRWNKVSDQSREMFPLLECLSYVATALNDTFAPFSKPIFTRCINIIHKNLEEYWVAANNAGIDVPEKDFLVTSLDLLSAIIQALDERKSAELVATSQPNMFELLAFCMKDNNNDVRQSAYALLGDSAIYVFPQLQPYLPSILTILLEQLELSQIAIDAAETGYAVINNACWSVGEIAMRQREGMAQYVEPLLTKLGTILFNDKVPESLNENAAIALGRLGIGCANALAPHLATVAPPFLMAIRNVDWTDEKGHALRGFANIVMHNPRAMEQCLLDFMLELANAPHEFLDGLKEDGPKEVFEQVRTKGANFRIFSA
ncbi:armadillo-type protein [Lineolata rhizophorae]|uniref:Armadillo-type protein n=1 Tax=Lineolata rhizophorae TaxID=578093 RepID=A0A6A6PD64_9PEZI|nr:armadillo-type protein [Lineolata rhizophorae]